MPAHDTKASPSSYDTNKSITVSETDIAPLEQPNELDVDAIRRVMTKTVQDANDIRNLESQKARKHFYERTAMGTLTEQLCYEGTGAQNLNDVISNFPWADGATSGELQQVKSHVNMSIEKAMDAYAKDFSKTLGVSEDSKIDKAVDEMWNLRSTEAWNKICAQLPPDVVSAGDKEALKKAMLENVVLRIPSEDVPRVQEYVRAQAMKHPENYGLENPTGEAIERLVARIKPATSDLTNHQLRLMARDVFQQKMEILGYPRGVAYAKHTRAMTAQYAL